MSPDRRDFVRTAGLAALGLASGLSRFSLAQESPSLSYPDLSVVTGGDPRKITRAAVELLGGMKRFVSKGDVVVVKPNIGWDRSPQQAANTNPEVVAEVIELCLEAGAKTVKVFDRTCNSPRRCYDNSGIQAAAEKAGAKVSHTVEPGFKKVQMPRNKLMKAWEMYAPALEADCLINVPVAKHHSIAGLTIGMKNLMGIMGGERGQIHWAIHEYLPELADFVRPKLTVVDAVRILVANGPQGGSLDDVRKLDTVIASPHIASADAYAATLFGKSPDRVGYIRNASRLGLGEIDLDRLNIKQESIS